MEARKSYKSFEFKISVCWQRAFRGLMTRAGHQEVVIGSPPEFKGDPDVWCPEELLIGSVSTCLMLTFLSYSERRRLTVLGYESEAVGIVENLDGKYRITRITLQPQITLESEADKALAENTLEDAKEGCFISNSITARVELAPQFVVE